LIRSWARTFVHPDREPAPKAYRHAEKTG